MYENKRKHKRLPIELRAELTVNGNGTFTGKTANISFGGAYVNCEDLANTLNHEECSIKLILESSSEPPIEIESKIVRADSLGVGVMFKTIDILDYQRFEKLMVYNSPDAMELMAELERNPGMMIRTYGD